MVATIAGDSTYTPTADGDYTVQVTNSIATKLTLYSDTLTFTSLKAAGESNITAQTPYKNSFSIYPNPAKTTITIVFKATGNYTLKLMDVNGNVLQTKTGVAINHTNALQLNIGKYASGVYFLMITDEENKKQTLRLNKQ